MARSLSMGRAYIATWVATFCVSSRPLGQPKHVQCRRTSGKLFGKKRRQSDKIESRSSNLQGEVQAICEVLRENSWGDDAEKKLKQALKKLTSDHVVEVLKRMDSVEMSVGFFLWAGKQDGYKHNSVTYHGILKLVGRKQEFQCLEKLLKAMRLDNCKLNTVTFNIIISSYGRAGLMNKAWSTFSKMKAHRCVPDTLTYNSLLNAHVKKGDWRKAKEIYSQMAKIGPSPDTYTFNTLIDGLTKEKRMKDACLLLREMIQSGYLPTAVSYNTLMKGLCQEGQVDEAHTLLSNMLKNQCIPTVVTYNTIIDGMCKMGRVEDAAQILHAMRESKCFPDVQTYTVMINGYTEAGLMDEAWSLFLEMKNKGCIPDVITYGVLMDGFCKANRLEAAFELLPEMLGKKIPLNTIVYTMFIDCLCKTNKSELAHTILDDMICNFCIPDAVTYRALINGLSKSGQTARAYGLMMNLVKESSNYPSLQNCKAFIDGLCKSGYVEEAMSWFDELCNKKRAPDIVTYKLLIGSNCRAGRPDDAYKLVKRMAQAGLSLSRKYYLNIIVGFCNQESFDSACKVFEDLMSARISLPEGASKAVGDISCAESDVAEATALLYRALEASPAEHLVSFVEVFYFLCQGDHSTVAKLLLEHMMHQHCFRTILDGVKVLHAWLSYGELQKSILALTGVKNSYTEMV